MSESPDTTTLFACDACGNVGVGTGDISCCEGPMQRVAHPDDGIDESPLDATDESTRGAIDEPALDAIDEPTLEDLLRTVFDMSDTELDVCLCVMEGGPQTVKELAAEIDYDRSVVARHLNHLADLGVVEKHRRLLEEGGHVYVYTPTGPDVVRDRFTQLFLWWVQLATEQLDALRREKVEAIVDAEAREPQWRIYQQE